MAGCWDKKGSRTVSAGQCATVLVRPPAFRSKLTRYDIAVYMGDECLFGIMDVVSSTSPEFAATFRLSFPLVLRQSPTASSTSLSTTLSAFNTSASDTTFATTSHQCPLCFSSHRGNACIRLASCGCVFCTPCLNDYFSLLITEGLVRSVACPSEGCVRARALWEKEVGPKGEVEKEGERPGRLTADEVERLCGAEKRKRYEWLKEKVRVESGASSSFAVGLDSSTAG